MLLSQMTERDRRFLSEYAAGDQADGDSPFAGPN